MIQKISVLLILFILIAPVAIAESNKVVIVDFKYEDGTLIFNDKLIKHGYSPDRKLDIGDYTASIISLNNAELYRFDFNIPLTEFVDLSNTTRGLSGGIVQYTETEFALVMPYSDEAKELQIFDPANKKVLTIELREKRELQKGHTSFYLLLLILLIGVILVLTRKRKK